MSDFLASHGRQALSDDMAEQVVGGMNGLYLNGVWTPEEEVYDLFINMAGAYNFDVAANVFCEMTGFDKNEIAAARSGNQSDKENMYCLITQCFTTFDKIQNGGKTF